MKKQLPVIALVISMIIWSVSGIAIKHALAVLPPFTMIVMRFVPAVLLMLVIGLVRRKHSLFCLQKMDLKDLPLFLIAGTCQPFLYYLLETFTYDALNSPTIAETLLSTSPLLSPIFAALLLRERVTKYNIIGILISTGGVFALTLIGATDYSIGNSWGILLAFAAVSAAVVDSIMMRKAPQKYSALSFVFYTQLISLMYFIPIWLWREGPQAIYNVQCTTDQSQLLVALGCVAYLSVFASVVAFILFCYALRQIGVTQANAFNNIRPAFTALWMLLFFGEHLPVGKWIGMILIIFGLFVCQKQEKVSDC
ncbi:MAG: EamA family transporter [Paludibacteraceae bacterium]|nr:EamA family transporter [Paludibacteraceae bacterium]MBQ2520384.1 EamA family transporter [Paludibacteraceae bacterium]MBQ4018676.1 EamA family transporter [Paludibacteraceae bacterium]